MGSTARSFVAAPASRFVSILCRSSTPTSSVSRQRPFRNFNRDLKLRRTVSWDKQLSMYLIISYL